MLYNRKLKTEFYAIDNNKNFTLMYIFFISASFALFTLTIIHFKRLHSKPNTEGSDVTVDGVVSPIGTKGITNVLPARIFTTSWSLDLGWGGVMLCVMTSVLWILLSKIMRFNPISSMINLFLVYSKTN